MGFKDYLTKSLHEHMPFYSGGEGAIEDLAAQVHADVTVPLYSEIVGETEKLVVGLLDLAVEAAVLGPDQDHVIYELRMLRQQTVESFVAEGKK